MLTNILDVSSIWNDSLDASSKQFLVWKESSLCLIFIWYQKYITDCLDAQQWSTVSAPKLT